MLLHQWQPGRCCGDPNDYGVKLGDIGGAPFYVSGSQYEAWKHADFIIDVVPGRGGMFSPARPRATLPSPIHAVQRQIEAIDAIAARISRKPVI